MRLNKPFKTAAARVVVDLVHHDDRGSQYLAMCYEDRLFPVHFTLDPESPGSLSNSSEHTKLPARACLGSLRQQRPAHQRRILIRVDCSEALVDR